MKATATAALANGFSDVRMFPNARSAVGTVRFVDKPAVGRTVESTVPVSSKLARLQGDELGSMLNSGHRLNFYRSLTGALTYNYVPEPQAARPRLYLIETYRLSSFLGSYGAGRILKTFTLLPGEKTKISVKTFPPLCQRRLRQSFFDICVPSGGEWSRTRAQANLCF